MTGKLAWLLVAAALAWQLRPALAEGAPENSDLNRSRAAASSDSSSGSARGEQADWKGVTPGKSTRAQVEALLGRPAAIRNTDGGGVQYLYEPGANLGFNRVVFGPDGVVQLVGIGLFGEKDKLRFSELARKYGAPRRLSQHSLRDYHSDQGIYQFPREAGLWVVADETTDEVQGATFYDPAREPEIPVPTSAPSK